MAIRERYLAYADAFEETFKDDDWSRIGQYFTPDATYEGEPSARGREAVLAKLKGGIDAFDRRMDSRTISFEEPSVQGNTVRVRWKGRYTKRGLPDLNISGAEIAEFQGDQIALLRDEFDPEAQKEMGEWMTRHGQTLQGS
jgi:hypothetical protein